MAIALSLEWIVSDFTLHRKVEDDPAPAAVGEVTLSYGEKVSDGESVRTTPAGEELWKERFAKTFPLARQDVADYLAAWHADPDGFAYKATSAIPDPPGFLDLDSAIAGPIYQIARWMADTGRWEV